MGETTFHTTFSTNQFLHFRAKNGSESGLRSAVSYRFGFNGQEMDNEISGQPGTHTTAMFWEYDSRLGRRWNLDPVVKPFESLYSCFCGNPIYLADPSGLDGEIPPKGKTIGASSGTGTAEDPCYTEGNITEGVYDLKPVDIIDNRINQPEIRVTTHVTYEKPNLWQRIGNFFKSAENSIKGKAIWTFGIEYKTSDGKWNGVTSNPIPQEYWDNLLTVNNWDKKSEILDLLLLSLETFENASYENPFGYYQIKVPSNNQINKKIKAAGMPPKAVKITMQQYKVFKKLIDGKCMLRTQIPGKSKIGGFNSQPPESVPDSQWIEVTYHNEHGDVIGTGKEKVCKPYWH